MDPVPAGMPPRLTGLGKIRAVLFDVYGTLLISGSGDVGTAAAADTAEAFVQALEAAGFKGMTNRAGELGRSFLKEAVAEWHARSRAEGIAFPEVDILRIWDQVLEKLRSSGSISSAQGGEELIARLAVEYVCWVNPVWPMPGCLNLLHTLRHRGIILGIVSNAQFYTPLLFTAFFGRTVEGLGFDSDLCLWSYRERRGKPDEALFPKATDILARKYGISQEQTVCLGNDMLNDIYSAKRAGCRTVLFAGDRRSLRMRQDDERCAVLQPDAVITSLAQLPPLLTEG